eukprot:TRINITY_DN433_c0_g1_i1.p1 TRINITY_DN433_c0_g1~~TRINITY_DN433_c0_g1_i1.p1  ORF type:complete len:286 (+),score=55.04 TRINITY_DN433_c0_g1_i1:635-1492(+)
MLRAIIAVYLIAFIATILAASTNQPAEGSTNINVKDLTMYRASVNSRGATAFFNLEDTNGFNANSGVQIVESTIPCEGSNSCGFFTNFAALRTQATGFDTPSFSVELWAKPSASSFFQTAFSYRNIGNGGDYQVHPIDIAGFALFYQPNNKFMLVFGGCNAAWQAVEATDASPADEWYHVTGTYDSASFTAKIYINGVLEGTLTTANCAYVPVNQPGSVLRIGSVWNSVAAEEQSFWDGYIDEVAYYPFALSPELVAQGFKQCQPWCTSCNAAIRAKVCENLGSC